MFVKSLSTVCIPTTDGGIVGDWITGEANWLCRKLSLS